MTMIMSMSVIIMIIVRTIRCIIIMCTYELLMIILISWLLLPQRRVGRGRGRRAAAGVPLELQKLLGRHRPAAYTIL